MSPNFWCIPVTDLQEVPGPNVVDQLKGRVAGLDITTNSTTPGAAGQIRLRGERSFATTQSAADATNGPLFLVDGVPFIGADTDSWLNTATSSDAPLLFDKKITLKNLLMPV